jgi:uncharacterized protein
MLRLQRLAGPGGSWASTFQRRLSSLLEYSRKCGVVMLAHVLQTRIVDHQRNRSRARIHKAARVRRFLIFYSLDTRASTPTFGVGNRFTHDGFIVNNIQVEGSILCYSDIWLLWKAASITDITPSSLAFVDVVKPAPDVVILGTGARMQKPSPAVSEYLKARGVALEVLDTVRTPDFEARVGSHLMHQVLSSPGVVHLATT